ncbi:MAG: hypothetical protein OXE52_08700 [Chloroflexi bacterium]|nr:hypothetical protein [Chloroflexota bacterium]
MEKKYRTALEQSYLLTEGIKRGEKPGDAIPGFEGIVYKARRNNRAVSGGARKGYRFIYCIHPPDQATMISVYGKTEQENISDSEIAELLKDVERRLSGN